MRESIAAKLDIKPTANIRPKQRERVATNDTTTKPQEQGYKAYNTDQSKTKQGNLSLRTKSNGRYSVPYSLIILLHMSSDQFITLYCTGYTITIEGENLSELGNLLDVRKVAYVQEWNEKKGRDTLPEGTPIVTEINILFGKPQEESC